MEGSARRIDLDRLPIKRVDAIDELGNEQFPPDVGHEEKRLSLIRRIDFSSVVEKDAKKHKKSSKEEEEAAAAGPHQAWPWQGLVENLQLAHQELSVIIDLINTVEANDAVAVAGMQRPKQLPNEVLADLAVSAATKFQRLRQLGRYFKQASKAMEQKVSREAKFYSSLIRLQQNWKVKRQRLVTTGPGSEGFTFDLLDNTSLDWGPLSRPSSISTVRVDHDAAGYLTIQRPQKSFQSISIQFFGTDHRCEQTTFSKTNVHSSGELPSAAVKEALIDDASELVHDTHSVLRETHQSIFVEQVFYMVNHEMFNPSLGINVTGMREDILQLAIGQSTSLCFCLVPYGKDDGYQMMDCTEHITGENGFSISDSLALATVNENSDLHKMSTLVFPSPISLEIYLLHIFHENVFKSPKNRCITVDLCQLPCEPAGDCGGLLGHFCKTVAHRIFANKVLSELECLVSRVPYLHLLSHPTWHSRTSAWSLSLRVPKSVLQLRRQSKPSDNNQVKCGMRSKFHTKVEVKDDQITVGGEGAPNIIGSLRGNSAVSCSMSCYCCDLEDLPMILLQQVAGQIIRWLHEEALVVGMKANRDFLCLLFDLDQGDMLGLVAHVDPDDNYGCISWWMVLDDGLTEEKLSNEGSEHTNRRFLGHLSLESLYSLVMDLVSLCSASASGSH